MEDRIDRIIEFSELGSFHRHPRQDVTRRGMFVRLGFSNRGASRTPTCC